MVSVDVAVLDNVSGIYAFEYFSGEGAFSASGDGAFRASERIILVATINDTAGNTLTML